MLDVREYHCERTLAELYDPDLMPDDLRAAHAEVDALVAGFNAPRPAQRKEAWTPNQPAREPADDQEAESKQENTPGWRSRIARATQAAKQRDESQFSNGVPLPPEPEPDFGAPPEEPPAYTRDDEERDMVEAAQSAGEMDHRSATEIAIELVEKELGARRV